MILVDANIFLEVLLQQSKYKECENFLESIQKGTMEAFVSRFSLYSIEILMTRLKRVNELKTFLSVLSTFKGLTIVSTSFTDNLHILNIMKKFNLDFDDALNYHVVKKYNLTK